MGNWIAFFIGLFIGGGIGALAIAITCAAKLCDTYLDGWNACMDRYKLRPVPFPPLWKDELKLHRAPETARDGGA